MGFFDALTAPKRRSLRWWDGNGFADAPWDDVIASAATAAAGLRDRGVSPGTAMACVLTNSRPVLEGMLGTWMAGGAVASLPVPARAMSLAEYAAQLVALTAHVGSPVLLCERRLIAALAEPIDGRVALVAWEDLPAGRAFDPEPPGDDDIAFIQYSSGSTDAPKGCALTPRAIGSQLDMLAEMVAAAPGRDTVASWLPLSHDMGTFGCVLFSWAFDLGLVLSSPERFMRDPRTWFGDCADHAATMSAGPPSALDVAARSQRTRPLDHPLVLRACVIGAERIGWGVLGAATDAFAPHGLTTRAWLPAYGLAEATLAVSGVGVAEEPAVRHVDTVALADGHVVELAADDPAATQVVSVGRPCVGVEVTFAEPGGLSEVQVRSPSLATGYYRDPERTAVSFRDGMLATGDLGFMRDGELYVVGRGDDVLSVAGRKVYAREIEAEVDLFDAVRGGCSTIVDVSAEARNRLVMLVELTDEAADCRVLATEASRAAKAKAGMLLDECVFLQRGALPKTPSGKIQRFRCRQMLLSEALEPLERVRITARR